MTHALLTGTTLPLPVAAVRAVLRWLPRSGGGDAPDLDVSALLVGPAGRVRSEADLVFYNQPRHPSGQVRRLPKQRDAHGLSDAVEVDLTRLDPGVAAVVVAASAERGFHAEASSPQLLLHDAMGGVALAALPLAPGPAETAVVCGELRRCAGGWEFRASGQAFTGGLAGLAAEFGVSASAPHPAPPAPQPQPSYGYAQPDPGFTLPPQGPQFLPPEACR